MVKQQQPTTKTETTTTKTEESKHWMDVCNLKEKDIISKSKVSFNKRLRNMINNELTSQRKSSETLGIIINDLIDIFADINAYALCQLYKDKILIEEQNLKLSDMIYEALTEKSEVYLKDIKNDRK